MRAASLVCAAVGILASGAAAAQASFALNTLYYCPNNVTFRVTTCSGNGDGDYCGVLMWMQGQAMPPGRSTRAQIATLAQRCSTQGPNAVNSAIPPQAPAPAYRPGGKFQENDHVKVNIRGQGWMDGTIVSIVNGIDPEYHVQVPGKGVAIATEADLRFVSAGPDPATAAANAAPVAGRVSCAGKFEGRYSSPPGTPGMVTVVFRSGNADVTTPDMVGSANGVTAMQSTHRAACTTGGGKIYLRWLDGPNMDFTMDINNDGSLDTPYGEIVKKGN